MPISFSADQFNAFRQFRLRAFAERLATRARNLHAAACADKSDMELIDTMERVIEAARALGLVKSSQMERFSDLSLALGVGFETERDWAAAVFSDKSLGPLARLRKVEASAVFVLRET